MRRIATTVALVAGLVLVSAPAARAQGTCTALGRVVDGEGSPIPDVQVLLDYKGHVVQKYRTKTDKSGVFTHVNVYTGPYRITLKKDGVGERSFDFNIQEIDRLQKPPEFKLLPPRQAAPPPPGSGMAPATPAPGGPSVDTNKLAGDINAAMALSGEGKTDEAIAAYESILAIAPAIPLVHYNLGTAYNKKGEKPKAEAAMRRSVELDPLFVDGYVGLATLFAEGGEARRGHQGRAAGCRRERAERAAAVRSRGAGRGRWRGGHGPEGLPGGRTGSTRRMSRRSTTWQPSRST